MYSSQAASRRVDVGLLDPQRRVLGVCDHRCAQVGADVEQLVLHPSEDRHDLLGEAPERDRGADGGVGLIGVGVGGEPQVVLAGTRYMSPRAVVPSSPVRV